MSVTERLQKPGQFSVKLRDDAPQSAWDAVALMDHIVITPGRLEPIAGFTNATILAAAIYTGVVTGKPSPTEFYGQGLGYWLGTDEGLGDLLDTKVSNTAGSLSTWITSLRPSSLSAGTVTNAGTSTLTADYQFTSRREALDHACRAMGAEYRINPAFTLDAAVPGTLHTNYTTPKAVITRKPEGSEGSLIGLQATDIVRGQDVNGYTTKVIVVGRNGDGAQFASGSATGANVYKDGLNNNVTMERLVDAPAETAGTVAAYAQSVLNLFGSSRKSVRLSSATYAATTKVRPGDRVYVFDQRAGLTDTANQITWRGELITPVVLRCKAITWAIQRGMGVYARRSGATPTYYDLSDFVAYEAADTQWEVGTSTADTDQDPEQLGVAYLGANPGIVARGAIGGEYTWTPTLTNVTGGTVIASGTIIGKLFVGCVNITAGTATAAGTISASLGAGITARSTAGAHNAVTALLATGGLLTDTTSARILAGATTVQVYATDAGANFTLGQSVVCTLNFSIFID